MFELIEERKIFNFVSIVCIDDEINLSFNGKANDDFSLLSVGLLRVYSFTVYIVLCNM